MIGKLTLDQLRVLVAIAENGSFSAAAHKLRRVQSAISQTVQTLEQAQNVALFDRSSRTPKLTEAGRLLVLRARQVLVQAAMFESAAEAIAAGQEAELAIAVDCFLNESVLLDSLRDLHAQFPDLSVSLYKEGIWASERRVRQGLATLGICLIHPHTAQDLQSHFITWLKLIPVVAPNHPLASETRWLDKQMLSEHFQLTLTDPTGIDLVEHAVVSPRLWKFVDLTQRHEMLRRGIGWANMPFHLVADDVESGKLVKLPVRDPAITPEPVAIFAVYRRDHPPRRAARWLLENLRKRFEGAPAIARPGDDISELLTL